MWFNKIGGHVVADFRIEGSLLRNGYANIAGIDEAGRGALFGPVVAVSVMFPDDFIRGNQEAWVSEIDDSKLLTPKKRQRLAKAILATAKAIGIGTATNKEIDKINIRMASFEAMKRAVTKSPSRRVEALGVKPLQLWIAIDGVHQAGHVLTQIRGHGSHAGQEQV